LNFQKFLLNKCTDYKGRKLKDILKFSNNKIEETHDFIQLIFPLNEPSFFSSNKNYIKSSEQLKELKSNLQIKKNILNSADWFISFLSKNNHWITHYDHNHLRITRMIKSVRLIVGNAEANNIYNKIISIEGVLINVSKKSLKYWKEA
jgi:hypothetical protein